RGPAGIDPALDSAAARRGAGRARGRNRCRCRFGRCGRDFRHRFCSVYRRAVALSRLARGFIAITGVIRCWPARARRTRPGEKWEENLEKIWLTSYPAGGPAEINIDSYASIREALEERSGKVGAQHAALGLRGRRY